MAYDPCTVEKPAPADPDTPTRGEYVVNKFHPSADDANADGWGTVNAPCATLPTTGGSSHAFPAGTKIFVYGASYNEMHAFDHPKRCDVSVHSLK